MIAGLRARTLTGHVENERVPQLTGNAGSASIGAESVLVLAAGVSVQGLGEDEGGVILRLDTGELYTVNDTALGFLKRLDGKATIAAVAAELAAVYGAEPSAIASDCIEIANALHEEMLIEKR